MAHRGQMMSDLLFVDIQIIQSAIGLQMRNTFGMRISSILFSACNLLLIRKMFHHVTLIR